MKKLLGLLLLAGAAIIGYRYIQTQGAVGAYEQFAEAWTLGDKTLAMKHAEEATATRAIEKQSLRGLQSGAMIDAFRGTRYEVESTARTPEGDVVLEVKQTIQFDPPGVTSAITGAMYTHIHHSATVRKTPDGWKVVAFVPTFIDMGELHPH
jgi:hypothetical protein